MSSAGHILDMINRLKANQRREKRKSIFERPVDEVNHTRLKKRADHPDISGERRTQIKEAFKRRHKRDTKRTFYILLIALILTLGVFLFFNSIWPFLMGVQGS